MTWEEHNDKLQEMWEDNAGSLTADMVMGYIYENGWLDIPNLLKKQREICAIVYNDNIKIKGIEVTKKIWEAPEPK